MKNVILADKAGFCFGVKRAVDEALNIKNKFNKDIYTLGPLIHNNDVVNYLMKNNIFPIKLEEIDKLNKNDVIIIRSHGITPEVYNTLKATVDNVIDATCPHVSIIHQKAKKYYDLGYGIVIVGDKNHPEVEGINGWCDNKAFISKDGSDLQSIPRRVCVLSQTTEKQENFEKVLNIIGKTCREIIAFNTICSATEVRQKTAEEISKKVDAMIVIGGKNSSNTTKLYEICKNNCKYTIHVENAGEIPDEIIKSKSIINIGVTAGASTPEWIIKEALIKMNEENNQEVNEQLAFMQQNDRQIVVGETLKGEVISVNEKEIFLNVGYKVDAILPENEVLKDASVKLSDMFKIGDFIQVKIISRRNDDGFIVLSAIELEREKGYSELKTSFENGQSINVFVKESVKGGLISSYKGVRVFIPASHVELYHVDDLNSYIGKEIGIKIIELVEGRKNSRIVGSRKELLKVDKDKLDEVTWEKLQKGDIVEGEVKRLADFGAFVDINGVDGLLHVSQISWARVTKPADILKVSDRIKVLILDIDKENKKISLSMKALFEDPWINVEAKYPVDSIVLCKVLRFASFGAFVELEPGVDALVHVSEISHKRIGKPDEALTIGQQVKAKILDVNKESKKIGLSIKEANEL
ncbi:MAG: bifunctional 4-hydroxy-3-methylbut-2-enyl diphosphate reductase/30S ribosomal protein S1 [Clostridiaceae bacterium]|nr:bifunctional 4-hydroxy-3-methylbut-2-enyl diphosphate reductase/30S ribosomal protein S1 [Clostridiaceae bacterium]